MSGLKKSGPDQKRALKKPAFEIGQVALPKPYRPHRRFRYFDEYKALDEFCD